MDEQDLPWKAEKIDILFKRNGIYPSTIYEIRYEAGGILSSLSEHQGKKTVFSGYEISPDAFEICKKARHNLNYFHKNLLDDCEAEFDVVMAIDIFEHVENYLGFLHRLQEKGVYKVFHIPLDLSVQTVLPVLQL